MKPMDWALLPFKRYFDFGGRSSRAEYWYFSALTWLIYLVTLLVELTFEEAERSVTHVYALFALITLIPSISVTVRRLHDINRSGFVLLKYSILLFAAMFWFSFATVVGLPGATIAAVAAIAIYFRLLLLMIIEGDRGPNPYGPNPYGLNYGY